MTTPSPVITLHISGERQSGKTVLAALIKEILTAQGFQEVIIEHHPYMPITPEVILAHAREAGFKPELIKVRIEDLDNETPSRDERFARAIDEVAAMSELMAKIKNSRRTAVEIAAMELDQLQPYFVNSQTVGRVIRYNPKLLNAKPMTRAEYVAFRDWSLPADENGDDAGHLVEYLDGGKPNHPRLQGVHQLEPSDVFDRAYKLTNGLSFGGAIEALKMGQRVARDGWNGKGVFLLLIQGSNKLASFHSFGFGEALGEPTFQDSIFLKTANNELVAWTVSQSDALATDWVIL